MEFKLKTKLLVLAKKKQGSMGGNVGTIVAS